jgi:hypothetical protein
MARWLIHEAQWTTLSTNSADVSGVPFGETVSFSDGPRDNSTGIPFFYLMSLEPTGINIAKDNRASLSVAEKQIPGQCSKVDAQSPICAKVTLRGRLVRVVDGQELDFARESLFSRHPEMESWPHNEEHDFEFFKLNLEHVFLLDTFGGPPYISVSDYLGVDLNQGDQQ